LRHLPRMLTLAAVAATAVAAAAPPPTPPLRVTAIPEARDDFQKNEAVFTAWLGRQTGVPVVLRLAGSYEEAVRLLVSKEADLGWLGGVTTVQVMTQTGGRVHPIVIREKDREFKSYLIAASSLEARSVQALRGKRFTFGSPLSTSGHVMPRFFLLRRGQVGVVARCGRRPERGQAPREPVAAPSPPARGNRDLSTSGRTHRGTAGRSWRRPR
jgi:phosphonate transport system substrate-binding protein